MVAPMMRTIKVLTILVLTVPLALLTTGFTAPVKASSDSPVIEWTEKISARAVIQTGDGEYAIVTDGGGDFCLENVILGETYSGIEPMEDRTMIKLIV